LWPLTQADILVPITLLRVMDGTLAGMEWKNAYESPHSKHRRRASSNPGGDGLPFGCRPGKRVARSSK